MVHFDRYLLVRISYPKTYPLLSSLMRWASCKCEMPQLEWESSAKFLAIKCCQRTKIEKVIKLSQSSIKNGHVSATIGVKLLRRNGYCSDQQVLVRGRMRMSVGRLWQAEAVIENFRQRWWPFQARVGDTSGREVTMAMTRLCPRWATLTT